MINRHDNKSYTILLINFIEITTIRFNMFSMIRYTINIHSQKYVKKFVICLAKCILEDSLIVMELILLTNI